MEKTLIVNGKVWTGTQEEVVLFDILVEGTKIVKVEKEIDRQADWIVIDAKGGWVTPGVIDVHTHLGVFAQDVGKAGHDFNETTKPCTPEVRALDGIHPEDSGFADARRAGITTVQVLPGSANVIGGETCVIKTVGNTVEDMIVQSPSAMKGALGENPKNIHGPKGKMPLTRMGVAAVLRQELMKAQDYGKQKEQGTLTTRDLGMEQLLPVVNGELPMRIHAHRADDIATAIRIAKEFNINMTIEHVTEGHLIVDELRASGFRFTIGPTFSARSKQELANKSWETVKRFADTGSPFTITTDHPVIPIEHLITTASHALKYGVSENTMLKALTVYAAEHLQIEDRLGTLEEGKDADMVIWSEHPLAITSVVQQTIINGETVYTKQ
ncbi:amidohydrolase [Shouchella sp. 1P09AA]|uniref:amidohydrolase n=1 Tax=unclassified Shouchella TaxID=2893065 RepID=UPI0039A0FFD0